MVAVILGFVIAGGIGTAFLLNNGSIMIPKNQYEIMKYMTEKYEKTEELYSIIQDKYYQVYG